MPMGGPADTTGVIPAGQFVLEKGAVMRINTDNVYNFSQIINSQANGEQVIIEMFNGSRNLTNQNNQFIKPVVGTPTIATENDHISNGQMITNDASGLLL